MIKQIKKAKQFFFTYRNHIKPTNKTFTFNLVNNILKASFYL